MRQMRFLLSCTAALAAVWLLLAGLGAAAETASAAPHVPMAAISLNNAPYAQDFDTLANNAFITNTIVPTGWAFHETGTGANGGYRTGAGAANTGDTYSFGADATTERAFGTLLSGSLVATLGAEFQNDGDPIAELAINYHCEQWRLGATGRVDRLDFAYSTDATSLTDGTWTPVTSLNCESSQTTGTVGSLDGNTVRTIVSSTITMLNIGTGDTFWIRWTDFNATGADDGLAIDDFNLTPIAQVAQPPSVASTTPTNGATNVPVASTLGVTFNEPVTVTANWFNLTCTTGGTIATTSSATPATSYTITPSVALDNGDTCVGTVFAAEVSNADSLTMTADVTFTFSTAALTADITFVYNDLEGVVEMGETVWLGGAFNGWTPVQMSNAGAGVYTYTVTGLTPSTSYEYKYIVDTGSQEWDWLNTNNRSITVVGNATQQDYRHVVPGWANLDSPATMTGTAGMASNLVLGQLFINNVTNPAGEGRGLQAQVGYGNNTNPDSWAWFGMDFNAQLGNNDQFQGVFTPTLGGVFSYTTRYNGNWGTGNPNSAWYYGDLDGNVSGGGFSLDQTGVITVEGATLMQALHLSQFFGGNGGAYTHDFIEIFNRSNLSISLDGLSLQYASATGTGQFGGTANQLTELPNVTLLPGQYFLVQQASGTGGSPLPTPDHIDPTPINLSATSGKVALVIGNTSLGCNGGSTPCSPAQLERIIDLVGYGEANFYEGSGAAPLLTSSTAAHRNGAGCIDTDNNAADFTAAAPTPRNTATPINACIPTVSLNVNKSVFPAASVFGGDVVTYTITLANTGELTETAAILTDTLPTDVTFAQWVSQPAGAVASSTAVTWTGSINPLSNITLVFQANYSGPDSGTVTNTAYFSGTVSAGSDNAIFTAGLPTACQTDPTHRIHQVQGSGNSSPIVGQIVTVQAVVVSNFQGGTGTLNGFHIQEMDIHHDNDPATSEGIFIFNSTPVTVGDLVRVTGTVGEFQSGTQLASASVFICSSGHVITPTLVTLPLDEGVTWERYEGMLIKLEDLVATDNFRLGRFGQVRLAPHRLAQPTNVVAPGAPANALQALNNRSYLTLDDARTNQNPDPMIYPAPELSYINTLRGGDVVTQVVGIVDHFTGANGGDPYRLQPTQPVNFVATNLRQNTPPDVGGTVQVASFNVLNYFSTLDGNGNICGPLANQECRGADSALEFERQYTKIVTAIVQIDAAVVGLMEIENHATDAAVIDLVTRINAVAGAGVYDYIATGPIGGDAIKQAIIYQPALVTPVGTYAILDSSVDSRFDDTRNRPVIIQTFEENSSGERFTVAVNHLKSKGSACGASDPDMGDGQGNCNLTRTRAAEALVDYMATDPTNSGSQYFLIIGDLNAYAMEDPIMTIQNAGYTNLVSLFGGLYAYGYQFDGQWGYLDHALANNALVPFVTGTSEWHINADEPIVLDYNVEFKTANQINLFYGPGAFRSSDHDPVIVGLNFNPVVDVSIAKTAVASTVSAPSGMVQFTLHISNTGTAVATNVVVTDTLPTGLAVLTYTTNLAVTDITTLPSLIVWQVDDLAVGQSGTITLVAMLNDNNLPDGTLLTNHVAISANNDSDPNNNMASASVTVDNPTEPPVGTAEVGLSMSVSDSTIVYSGTVQFVLTISNTGDLTATNIVLTNTLPSGVELVSANSSLPFNQLDNDPLVWGLAALAPGQSGTVTLVVRLVENLPDGTQLTNQAQIGADNDTSPVNNTALASVTVVVPLPPTYTIFLPLISR